MARSSQSIDQFWSDIDRGMGEDGCWWSPRSGQFILNDWPSSLRQTAVQWVWQLTGHEYNSDFERLRHRCGNRSCCNPRHMYTGEQYRWSGAGGGIKPGSRRSGSGGGWRGERAGKRARALHVPSPWLSCSCEPKNGYFCAEHEGLSDDEKSKRIMEANRQW